MQELSRQPRTNFPGMTCEVQWVDALGLDSNYLFLHRVGYAWQNVAGGGAGQMERRVPLRGCLHGR